MARVFVITGPSGVGKGTLIRGLMARQPRLELSVSATTRSPRAGERDGEHYHFLGREEFDRRVVEGARQVRAAVPEAVQVFIAPPSLPALRERLAGRGTDDDDEVERRLAVAA